MNRYFRSLLALASCALLSSPTLAISGRMGGGSDGGGNSYRGKPLESYARDPAKLAAFQKQIQPLLQDLESKEDPGNPLYTLKKLIASVFTRKIWYFVPGPLEHIPADLLNSAVRTDQAALQDFDRVWIDAGIWDAMSVDDQARLLLHEAYMGLKILQYASSYRLCQAENDMTYSCNDNDRVDRPIALMAEDYVHVQKMTVRTATNYPSMTADDWISLIQQSGLKYPYDWFDQKLKITPSELGKRLLRSEKSGYLPNHGYNLRNFDLEEIQPTAPQALYEYLQKNKGVCYVQARVTGNSLHLQLTSKTENFDEVIPLPAKMVIRYDDLYHEKRNLQIIGITHQSYIQRPTGGFTLYNIMLNFDSYHLAMVYIQEMVCTEKDCRDPYIDVKGGMLYFCSDNGNLLKP